MPVKATAASINGGNSIAGKSLAASHPVDARPRHSPSSITTSRSSSRTVPAIRALIGVLRHSSVCARQCGDCAGCTGNGLFWCEQPGGGASFCSHDDVSEDNYLYVQVSPPLPLCLLRRFPSLLCNTASLSSTQSAPFSLPPLQHTLLFSFLLHSDHTCARCSGWHPPTPPSPLFLALTLALTCRESLLDPSRACGARSTCRRTL